MSYIGSFQLTSDEYQHEVRTRQYLSSSGGMMVFKSEQRGRDTITKVYEAPVSDDFQTPASPVNPGGLTPTTGAHSYGKWVCQTRSTTCGYGTPLSKRYTETWQYVTDWTTEEAD